MKTGVQVLKQLSGVTGANVGSSAITFAGFFGLGILLPAGDFRTLTLGYSVLTLAVAVADARVTVVRAMGVPESARSARQVRVWRYSIVALLLVVLLGLRAYLRLPTPIVLAVCLGAAAMSEFNAAMGRLIGRQAYKPWSICYLATNSAKSLLMLAVSPGGVVPVLLAYAAPPAVAAMSLGWTARVQRGSNPKATWRPEELPDLLPLVGATLVTALATRVELLLINGLIPSAEALAEYSKLVLVVNGQLLLQASLTALLLPRARELAADASALRRVGRLGALMMAASGLLVLLGLYVVPSYRETTLLYMVMTPALVLQGYTVSRSVKLYTWKRGRYLVLINTMELLVSAAVVLLAAGPFGIAGAAMARALSMIVGSLLTELVLRRAMREQEPAIL